MTETRVARVTGIGALGCVALSWLQFPLWVIGDPPSMYDGAGFARHLFDIRTMALLRVLMDQGIYVGMMVFAAGFRHLVRHARPESEWFGTLTFGAAAVWLAVTLVADGLMGGAVLDTLRGDADTAHVTDRQRKHWDAVAAGWATWFDWTERNFAPLLPAVVAPKGQEKGNIARP
jgi:hypothetical protein